MARNVLPKVVVALAAVVAALGASAAGVALSRGAPAPATRDAHAAHAPVQPATKAAGSTTTVTTSPSSTSSTVASTRSSGAPPVTTAPATATAPTTTPPPGPPPCQWSNFSVKVTGDTVSQDQVTFTAVAENDGPACTDSGQAHCDCWSAFVENDTDPADPVLVWDAADEGGATSSDGVWSPLPVWQPGQTTSPARVLTWDETVCTTTPCQGQPARTGSYLLFAEWAFHIGSVPPSQKDPNDASAIVSDAFGPVAVQ